MDGEWHTGHGGGYGASYPLGDFWTEYFTFTKARVFTDFEYVHPTTGPGFFYGSHYGVPEPATWAMMLGGFGIVGAAMRRRKVLVAFA